MKKFENFGRTLSKSEQMTITGGYVLPQGGYCNCYCGNGTVFSDPTSIPGCCTTAEGCLTRCNSQATCQTGDMYALCKGSCSSN